MHLISKKSLRLLPSIFAFALLTGVTEAQISYAVQVNVPDSTFEVSITVNSKPGSLKFSIPGWSPGYYQMASYQKTISDCQAKESSKSLTVTPDGDRTWDVQVPKTGSVTFSYHVHAVDPGLGFFGSHIDAQTGFINGASALMYVDGMKTKPDSLKVMAPNGWRIYDSLNQTGSGNGYKKYISPTGYDELIDCPIQLGHFTSTSFTDNGIPYTVLFVNDGKPLACNPSDVTKMLQLVSKPALDLFHGAAFKHYTYIMHLKVGSFAGGLEHRNCTVIALNDEPGLDFPAIAAHENFHAWNVKQIRPFELGPFDYQHQADTSQIWWSEGVTDYYSDILTYRSGLGDENWLLSQITDRVIDLQHEQGRLTTTLAECGKNTWGADGFSSGGLNYYTKGYLVGWILDASIRTMTDGKKSLDDVMRYMFATYRLPKPGFKKGDLLDAINKIVQRPGAFDQIYAQMVHSTDELPYGLVRNLGLQVIGDNMPQVSYPYTADKDGKVTGVEPSATSAGLKVGDQILKIEPVLWNLIGPNPGQTFQASVQRGGPSGQVINLKLPASMKPADNDQVITDPTSGPIQQNLLQQWLAR